MINRILIRIKTVQLLYSYLLLEKHFMIESQPTPPTKEKRYAYSLYLDTLYLMVRLAESVEKRGGERPLLDNRFIRQLNSDDKIKSVAGRAAAGDYLFAPIIPRLAEKVKESGVYKNFIKNRPVGSTVIDARVWEDILNTVILPDASYNAACERGENHSLRGVERMKEMLRATFTNYFASQGNVQDALEQLRKSLHKARELYFRLLLLPIELTELRANQIDENRHKYLRSQEDINPNMRFVENQLVEVLANNEKIGKYADEEKISWLQEDPVMMHNMLRRIMDSDLYKDYMEFPVTDFHTDCEFWRNAYKQIIFSDPDFLELLEDKSVFWNDDIDTIGTFVLKTFKRFDEGNEASENDTESVKEPIFDMYKDEEDARFGAELFTAVVKNQDIYRGYIDEVVDKSSWETERLAFMDIVVLVSALAEIINFPKIPIQVSFNEYIEIAKCYSTAKSGNFINGLLGKIIERLENEGIVTKQWIFPQN